MGSWTAPRAVPVSASAHGTLAEFGGNLRRIGDDVGVKADDWAVDPGDPEGYPAFGNCESLMNYRVAVDNQVFEEIDGCLYYRDTEDDDKTLALYPSGRDTLYFDDSITVTAIGDGACAWCCEFTELTIPDTVRTIGKRSFDFCREMTKLVIPEGVYTISPYAFIMNIGLLNVEIAGTVGEIGTGAFYHSFMSTDARSRLVIREGVRQIGASAFYNCQHLNEVVIEGAEYIWRNAFAQCYDLDTLSLPDNLTTIGPGAFCGCESLERLVVPLSVESIELSLPDDGSDGGAFAYMSTLQKAYLPVTLKPDTDEETMAFLLNIFDGIGNPALCVRPGLESAKNRRNGECFGHAP